MPHELTNESFLLRLRYGNDTTHSRDRSRRSIDADHMLQDRDVTDRLPIRIQQEMSIFRLQLSFSAATPKISSPDPKNRCFSSSVRTSVCLISSVILQIAITQGGAANAGTRSMPSCQIAYPQTGGACPVHRFVKRLRFFFHGATKGTTKKSYRFFGDRT